MANTNITVSYTHLQGREFVAVPEHAAHAGTAARVKVAYVQAGEGAAVGEHVVHSARVLT